jgi:hypothetical protein
MGLRTREEIPRAPMRMPISTSVDPDLERYIGMVGVRMWKTEVNANCAKKQRMNSRDNILRSVIRNSAERIMGLTVLTDGGLLPVVSSLSLSPTI